MLWPAALGIVPFIGMKLGVEVGIYGRLGGSPRLRKTERAPAPIALRWVLGCPGRLMRLLPSASNVWTWQFEPCVWFETRWSPVVGRARVKPLRIPNPFVPDFFADDLNDLLFRQALRLVTGFLLKPGPYDRFEEE